MLLLLSLFLLLLLLLSLLLLMLKGVPSYCQFDFDCFGQFHFISMINPFLYINTDGVKIRQPQSLALFLNGPTWGLYSLVVVVGMLNLPV